MVDAAVVLAAYLLGVPFGLRVVHIVPYRHLFAGMVAANFIPVAFAVLALAWVSAW